MPSAFDKLRQKALLPPPEVVDEVSMLRDFERILTLPKRPAVDCSEPYSAATQALIEVETEKLSLGPRACVCASELKMPCVTSLNAVQAWALREMRRVQGILGMVGVGGGKTILGILAPLVFPDCREAVLFIEPGQRIQYRNTYLRLREHFRVPSIRFHDDSSLGFTVPGTPTLRLITYSRFCRGAATDLLGGAVNPDLIISDEGHRFSNRLSAQTGRFLRYMVTYGEKTRFCVWSGTLVKKSLRDQAHLAAHALGFGSPMPLDPDEVEAWAAVFDPNARFPDYSSTLAHKLYRTFGKREAPSSLMGTTSAQRRLREGYQKRLTGTPGVISTKGSSVGASIYIHERPAPKLPPEVKEALDKVRGEWVRPDGEELVEAVDQFRCASEIASGFFYHWVFPNGEPADHIQRWFAARKHWNKELREKLKDAEVHLDSPMLCANAAERAWRQEPYDGGLPLWKAVTWPEWAAVKDTVYHESHAKWINDFLAKDAAEWAQSHRGIVWYLSDTFGRRVAQLAGLPCHGGGADSEKKLLAEKGDRSVICSIKAHGAGRDGLQHLFSKQLVAQLPSGGDVWEQLIGRLHRHGQQADEIETWVYQHVSENKEALRKAVQQAEFIEATTGNKQKLLLADIDIEHIR